MRTAPPRPAWAKAVIVAELHKDDSDIMTDYFNHTTARCVGLAWSRHTRDDFREMRSAAARFTETAHLGPGCDYYTPRVVVSCAESFTNGGRYMHDGDYSPWHSDLDRDAHGDLLAFATEADARAYIAGKGEPHPITVDGTPVSFRWTLGHTSIEHREKYSMGDGYYLKAGFGDSTGWAVKKRGFYRADDRGPAEWADEPAAATADAPDTAPTAGGITVTINAAKGGVEIRFPSKPAPAILSELKAAGWRWSRFSACWYTRDTARAREMAARMSGQAIAAPDEGHAPDFDRLIEEQRDQLYAFAD